MISEKTFKNFVVFVAILLVSCMVISYRIGIRHAAIDYKQSFPMVVNISGEYQDSSIMLRHEGFPKAYTGEGWKDLCICED